MELWITSPLKGRLSGTLAVQLAVTRESMRWFQKPRTTAPMGCATRVRLAPSAALPSLGDTSVMQHSTFVQSTNTMSSTNTAAHQAVLALLRRGFGDNDTALLL
ncbi:hypothetical protein H257_17603 [Aphanomyces astaci]|uniref:Uncharacterized protein n=1 Tax=Aphanomyces astaci TaxID=112090 RepID=W4FGC2_APHAT|nr:hypothetical protein H257_17603 [Aphanomyces astaci]ETV65793.1 hypothetical protein H257_17603 [Aphanomyces astaci]|eukprot:XP_009844768.1 hypothetical protein H257_17603 [Aphanomyces astaci]